MSNLMSNFSGSHHHRRGFFSYSSSSFHSSFSQTELFFQKNITHYTNVLFIEDCDGVKRAEHCTFLCETLHIFVLNLHIFEGCFFFNFKRKRRFFFFRIMEILIFKKKCQPSLKNLYIWIVSMYAYPK